MSSSKVGVGEPGKLEKLEDVDKSPHLGPLTW